MAVLSNIGWGLHYIEFGSAVSHSAAGLNRIADAKIPLLKIFRVADIGIPLCFVGFYSSLVPGYAVNRAVRDSGGTGRGSPATGHGQCAANNTNIGHSSRRCDGQPPAGETSIRFGCGILTSVGFRVGGRTTKFNEQCRINQGNSWPLSAR